MRCRSPSTRTFPPIGSVHIERRLQLVFARLVAVRERARPAPRQGDSRQA